MIADEDPDPSLIDFARQRLGEDRGLWQAIAARLERIDRNERRLTLWLLAIEAMAIHEYQIPQLIQGLQLLTFGIRDRERSPTIVAFVLPEATEDQQSVEEGLIVRGQFGEPLAIPIEILPWELTLHAPLNLRYGTLCCWTKLTAGGNGILTARHAFARHQLFLDDGSVQSVLSYAPNCLDAGIATAPDTSTLRQLPVAFPLAGDTVDVCTKRGPQARQIRYVSQAYGTVTAVLPHQFLLDSPLQRGDSGSLVRHTPSGEALGLYLGALTTPTGRYGLCQGMHQLDALFKATAFSKGFYEE